MLMFYVCILFINVAYCEWSLSMLTIIKRLALWCIYVPVLINKEHAETKSHVEKNHKNISVSYCCLIVFTDKELCRGEKKK